MKDYNILNDVSPEAFQQCLLYLYTGNLRITKGHVDDLLKIAERYELKEVTNACELRLIDKLNKSNASEMFQLAHRYRFNGALKTSSFDLIKQILAVCNQKLTDDMMEQPENVLKSVNLGIKLTATIAEMASKGKDEEAAAGIGTQTAGKGKKDENVEDKKTEDV